MREFEDEAGSVWLASIRERAGDDYKGRFGFQVKPKDGHGEEGFSVEELRWNSPWTAQRTLSTMAEKELRRLLKIARGRRGF